MLHHLQKGEGVKLNNTISTQGKFFVSAIVFFLLSIVLVLFLPITITETFYFNRDNIILLTPVKNLYLFTISLTIIFLSLVLLGFKRTHLTYCIASLLIIFSIVGGYFSLISYIAIQEKQIIVKNFQNKTIYPWSEIQEVLYEYDNGALGKYTFTTQNEYKFSIEETMRFGLDEKSAIYRIAYDNDIRFIERKIE